MKFDIIKAGALSALIHVALIFGLMTLPSFGGSKLKSNVIRVKLRMAGLGTGGGAEKLGGNGLDKPGEGEKQKENKAATKKKPHRKKMKSPLKKERIAKKLKKAKPPEKKEVAALIPRIEKKPVETEKPEHDTVEKTNESTDERGDEKAGIGKGPGGPAGPPGGEGPGFGPGKGQGRGGDDPDSNRSGNVWIKSYSARVKSIIARRKVYPASARLTGIEGRVVIRLTISSSGSLLKVSVVKSSSYPVLDNAALQAVRSAAPFPKFPSVAGRRSLTLGPLSLRYTLK